MNTALIQFLYLLFLGVLYLPIIFFMLQRRDEVYTAATWLVVAYALLAMVFNIAEAVWHNGEDAALLREFQTYAAITLIAIFALALQNFQKRQMWWIWIGAWIFWSLGLALILTNALNLPEMVWTNGELALYRSRLGPAWSILGWLAFSIGVILMLARANRRTRQQHFRNRLNYWWFPTILMLINDSLLFAGIPINGQPFRLAVALTMSYVIGTHHVPDLKHIIRRALIYLVITGVIVGFYIAGFLFLQAVFGNSRNFNPLIAGAFVSLLLALVFAPLTGAIARAVNRWMKADQYDASLTIHRYSESISNILDIDRLSSISIGVILETMQIERGFLFIVDSERQADGRKVYKIRSAKTPEERRVVAAELDENGVLASYFTRELRPLLQYDLDLLPAYRNASPGE